LIQHQAGHHQDGDQRKGWPGQERRDGWPSRPGLKTDPSALVLTANSFFSLKKRIEEKCFKILSKIHFSSLFF